MWPALIALVLTTTSQAAPLELKQGDHVCLIGNTLPERLQHDGWFETLIHSRFPRHQLVVRNLAFSADEVVIRQRSDGFGSPDDHLKSHKADVILAFFGFNESFHDKDGLDSFKKDLDAFLKHTLSQNYNGYTPPRIVLISPIATEDLKNPDLPDGHAINDRLAAYTEAMAEVARTNKVPFVDLYGPTRDLFAKTDEPLTINGIHLSSDGNRALAPVLDRVLFGPRPTAIDWTRLEPLRRAVLDKNFHWFHRYRTTDGYSTYGGRADLKFVDGQTNREVVQREMEVLDVMTANRDRRLWAVAQGGDLKINDANTPPFLTVKTNKPGEGPDGEHLYLGGEEAIGKMTVAKGMKVNLFASEEMFPELINPVQMAFDTKGRLWVAAWPMYPHWKPKEEMNDKLLILEDTDGDGQADKCITFADHLHNPTGFEFYGDGVLVAMAPYLLKLRDTDGDDRADVRERILGGLDSADTHHTANSFTLDPGGGLYFQEGVFHRTQVETPYGPVRNLNAGVWRFEPRTWKFERYVPFDFANPHGHAFGRWGQDYVVDGTGANPYDAALFSGYLDSPEKHPHPPQLYQQRTRPCPGIEVLSSKHFPEESQGNLLVANVIGFAGILQYRMDEKGASYAGTEVEPIIFSSDPNFRPADLEIGPDGALYFTDWHNPVIGHMQHNLRDPSRDKIHGRVYRVTVEGPPVDQSSPDRGPADPGAARAPQSPEDRVRYRARIELAARKTDEVLDAVKDWVANLDASDPDVEHHRLEALWVHQFHNVVNEDLLRRLLRSPDYHARAAATRVLCYWRDRVSDPLALLKTQANDDHPRVRLEAVRACSFFNDPKAAEVALEALKYPTDEYLSYTLRETMRQLEPFWKKAIAEGTPIALDNPAGIDYLLQSVNTVELVKLPRTPLVLQALLSRPEIPPQYREEALKGLAEKNQTDVTNELLAAIDRLDRAEGGTGDRALRDLAPLLFDHSGQTGDDHAHHARADLHAAHDRLATLAHSAQRPFTRQVALVALMTADGALDPAWSQAAGSPATLRDLLEAVPLIPDPALRAKAHERVRPLVTDLPPDLAEAAGKSKGLTGRYVRIELLRRRTLTLAEVQVFSDGVNIAPSGQATQSSVAYGGEPGRAIDGQTSGAYGDGGQTHTRENENHPWWELDLGSERPIEAVVIWNRTEDGGRYAKRLDGFRLSVLDASRQPVFQKSDLPAPADHTRFEFPGDPAGSIRRAAIAAIVTTGVDPAGTFHQLADLVRKDDQRDAAINAISRIPSRQWPRAEVRPLVDSIIARVSKLPASERTTPAARDALQLGNDLAALLPRHDAQSIRKALRALGVPVLVVRPVPHQILYDKTQLYVEAGRPVEIVFDNVDIMPHNFVVTAPARWRKSGSPPRRWPPTRTPTPATSCRSCPKCSTPPACSPPDSRNA